MSTVPKHLQQSFQRPTKQLQEQQTRTFSRIQQFNERKSIESSTGESERKHATKKEIKPKQLLRQATVAAIKAEERPENEKDIPPQSQDIEAIIVQELEDTNLNEQQNSATKDCQVYQNGKANEFFQNGTAQKHKSVPDVCLPNNHYILVKMPDPDTTSTSSGSHNNLMEASARRKEFRDSKEHNDNILKENEKKNKKLCRYLRSKRNRITRIAPIHEEPEDISDNEEKTQSKSYCLKMQSCWQANEQEVEIYETHTKIHKNIPSSICDHRQQKTAPQQSISPKLTTEESQCLDSLKSQHIETISGSLLKSSLHYQVSLHNHGYLVERQNNNNQHPEIINKPQRKKCPRLDSFYCLLRPFRSKSKPKIQAVVYKTYFVKWTKPPDVLNHGYGIKSLKSSHLEMSVLRRCRSALF